MTRSPSKYIIFDTIILISLLTVISFVTYFAAKTQDGKDKTC